MATGNIGPTAHGASDQFYGDSDADENPFEHDDASSHDVVSNNAQNNTPPQQQSTALQGQVKPFTITPRIPATTNTMPAAAFAQDRWQAFPSSTPNVLPFPTTVTTNRGSNVGTNYYGSSGMATGASTAPNMLARRLHHRTAAMPSSVQDVDMVDTEVETETEGETENEESGTEDEGNSANRAGYMSSRTAASALLPARADWSNNSEADWVSLINLEVRNARAGQADPHALRQLLRKAGFVPPSLRKDIWRLLILGRVNARTGRSGGSTTADIRALDAAILSTELNLDNQRVVRVDVERTRPALEQFKKPRVKNMLARVLTHHCKTHGLGYKQVSGDIPFARSWLVLLL